MFDMKPFLTLLLLMALALTTACSSGPTPEEIAKTAFEATVSADMTTAKPLYCPKMREGFPSQEDIDKMQEELNIKFNFDFSGLTYELIKEEGDRAVVKVSGMLVVEHPKGKEELEYNESIPLVLMDGKWLVCEKE